MTIEGNVIRADEGKVLRRKGTNDLYGKELSLGYSYYINGELQNPPHKDVPEDFEEIDEPVPEDMQEPPELRKGVSGDEDVLKKEDNESYPRQGYMSVESMQNFIDAMRRAGIDCSMEWDEKNNCYSFSVPEKDNER